MSETDKDGRDARAYWCFVSYRHADNREDGRQWATWLQYQLETYEVPPDLVGTNNERGERIPASIFPVFRDEEELSTGDLASRIHDALDRSRILIVLCSPRATGSEHVNREIRYFKSRRDPATCARTIHALIIEGEPAALGDPAVSCFPEALRHPLLHGELDRREMVEPLAADLRLPDGSQGWTNPDAYRLALQAHRDGLSPEEVERRVSDYRARSENALLRLIAGVLGVPYGVLKERDKSYQLKRARIQAAHQSSHLARALLDSDPVAALRQALEAVSVLEAEDPRSLPEVLDRIAPVLRSGRAARIGENVERVLPSASGRAILVAHVDGTVEVLGVPSLVARARYREVSELSEAWGPEAAWRTLTTGKRSVLVDMRTGESGLKPFSTVTRFVPPGDEEWWRPLASYNHPRGQYSSSLGLCFVTSINDDDEWGAVDSFVNRVDLAAGELSPVDDVYELFSNERTDMACALMRENAGWFLYTPTQRVHIGDTYDVSACRFSPAQSFAIISHDRRHGLRIHSCESARLVFEIPESDPEPTRVAFSADDALVLLLNARLCRVLAVPGFEEVARLAGDFESVSDVAAVAGVPGAWSLSSPDGTRMLMHSSRGSMELVRDADPQGRLAVLEGDDLRLMDVETGAEIHLGPATPVFSPNPAARVFATLHAGPEDAADGTDGPDRIEVRPIDDPARSISSTSRPEPSLGEGRIGVVNTRLFTLVWSFEREEPMDPPFRDYFHCSTEVFDVETGRSDISLGFAAREAWESRGERPALTFVRGDRDEFAVLHNGRREKLWEPRYGDPPVDRVETGAAEHHEAFVIVRRRAAGTVHRIDDGECLAALSGVVTRVEFDPGRSGVLAIWYANGRTELWRANRAGAVRLAELGLVVSDVHFLGKEPRVVVRHADGRVYLLSGRWLSAIADPTLSHERLLEAVRTHPHSPVAAAWWDAGYPKHHPYDGDSREH